MSGKVFPGTISRVQGGDTEFKPVLQISGIKSINPSQDPSKPSRYRLSLVDGQGSIQGMLATQLNELAENGSLTTGTIVQLTEFILQSLNGQQILVILNLTVVGHDENIVDSSTGAQQQQPQQQQQQQQKQAPPIPASYGGGIKPEQSTYGGSYGGSYAGSYGGQSNNRPVQRMNDSDMGNIIPISAINPYTNKWTIKARVTVKSDIKTWENARGSGKLFSVDLLDVHNGEIRGTFFKEAADKWFPILEQGQVYTFSGGRVKPADRRYSKLNSNYELTFDMSTDIKASHDDNIKTINYSFVKISDLPNYEINDSVDVVAIVRSAEDCKSIISQKLGGKELFKRDLVLYDDSNTEVRFTLWGDKAREEFDWSSVPILALKGVTVGEYNGRTLSMRNNSTMAINPDLQEAMNLFQWRQNGGGQSGVTSLSNAGTSVDREVPIQDRIEISTIKENSLGGGEKPDYVTFKGVVTHVFRDRDPWYTACPTPNCNKKVVEVFNGQWSCEKCGKEYPNCTRRFMLYASISDHTNDSGFTLFNDTAEKLLGRTADQLYEMKQSGNEAGYEKVFQEAVFTQVIVKARVKQEFRDDEMKTKSSVVSLQIPLDYAAECKKLLDGIAMYQ